MGTLILNDASASVRLEGEHLVVHSHVAPGAASRLPLASIERVLVVGRPAIAFPVLHAFMVRAIPCCFFDGVGRWLGALDCHDGRLYGRRQAQCACSLDEDFRLGIARRLVVAKIRNARRVVRRLAGNRSPRTLAAEANARIRFLARILRMARAVADLEALRGLEGAAARHHFALLGCLFPASLSFAARSRHPPKDAANALLSWFYALLLAEVVMAVHTHGLDPSAGNLHQNGQRAPALALDLMELFRPACDLLACNLASHAIVRADRHFVEADSGVRLNEEGRRVTLRAFAQTMERAFVPRESTRPTTLRLAIHAQAERYLAAILSGTPDFRPFRLP